MEDVNPLMYSAVALPSSTRAAPAKKRIWSPMGPISSDKVREYGLPVFSDSMPTSSSASASIRSASFNRKRWRSLGVVHRYVSNAAPAAWKAASMSAGPELGEVAYTSPVEGLMMSNVSPDAAGRSSPSMMLEKTCLSAMAVPFQPLLVRKSHHRPACSWWLWPPLLDVVLGASREGFWSKKPNGLSQNEMMSTGMIGQSSIRVMWWMPKTYPRTKYAPHRAASS